jgi:hypothetical protein
MAAAPMPANPSAPMAQPLVLTGLFAVIAWLIGFAVIEVAHDQLMAQPPAGSMWFLLYEIAGGYVLGFVTALAFSMLGRLVRGQGHDLLPDMPWVRWLAVAGLVAVIVSCVAGAVMHNFGGLTLTYDIAFIAGIIVVALAVLPMYRQLLATHTQ